MQKLRRLFFYTISHFFVDGICAVTVLQDSLEFSYSQLIVFLILYNFLAFATQPIAGLFIDEIKNKRNVVLVSFALLLLGFILPINQFLRILLVGTANSIFHVAAGTEILIQSNNKMYSNGVFVSTGAIGLTLGTLYSNSFILQVIFISLLLFCSLGIFFLCPVKEVKKQKQTQISWFIPASLLLCISIRSFMGFMQSAPFQNVAYLPIILTLFVFAGKFIGGFLCDIFSTKLVILVSVPLAIIFSFIGEYHFILWGMGLFCVNISMPITLYLLYQAMPNRPAFSFGLAASFLLPGLVLALYLKGLDTHLISVAILVLNLILLLISNRSIKETKENLSTTPSN